MTEETYRLTPKGFLGIVLYEELKKMVERQAKDDGCDDGVPCLIFDGGGVCQTCERQSLGEEVK